jgi:S-adenosylmethionine:tRNA ribosyltransferase-isomerase
MESPDELAEYDYPLPDELIARHPPARREDARLLVVDRSRGQFEHRMVSDLPAILQAGDLLVLNDSRVLPARLLGERAATGGRWEGLFLRTTAQGEWQLMMQTRGRLRPGETICILPARRQEAAERLNLRLLSRDDEGIWNARPEVEIEPFAALERFGTVPLPPYLGRDAADDDDFARYQTTYAASPGSVAAPTAGLHFTPRLLDDCRRQGVAHAFVTLHVGIGTFRPISARRLDEHRMHAEWCEVPAGTAAAIESTRAAGGRIVAVGTTSVRTLESAAAEGRLRAWRGETRLFIRPPYQFQSVDCLLTNFHLPRSTLLVLVGAFAGRERILQAYAEAVRERYRFFSYGDAMLIL